MVQADSERENSSQTETKKNVEQLQKALAEEKSKCEENLARWQRAQADFVNYKRYAEQEKSEVCRFANAGLLLNLLPVIDDFERALSNIPPEEAKQTWAEGIRLIDRKFRDIMEKQGVSRIQTLGQEFDPRFMEAIACGKGKKDTVVLELETGYKINDKVIRPAKVIVGTGEEVVKEE